MKRGLHDNEYMRVRQKAGWTNRPVPQTDFPDAEEVMINEQERAERIAAINADFKQRMAALDADNHKREVEMKSRVDAFSALCTVRAKMNEYEAHDVAPPFTEEDGSPKYSLSFLLMMGWTIETIGAERVLVRPKLGPARSL